MIGFMSTTDLLIEILDRLNASQQDTATQARIRELARLFAQAAMTDAGGEEASASIVAGPGNA